MRHINNGPNGITYSLSFSYSTYSCATMSAFDMVWVVLVLQYVYIDIEGLHRVVVRHFMGLIKR